VLPGQESRVESGNAAANDDVIVVGLGQLFQVVLNGCINMKL
jgi:hypothetical protein